MRCAAASVRNRPRSADEDGSTLFFFCLYANRCRPLLEIGLASPVHTASNAVRTAVLPTAARGMLHHRTGADGDGAKTL
jgi:hypothetical protein